MNTHYLNDLDYLEEDEQLQALGFRPTHHKLHDKRKPQATISADPQNDREFDILVTTYQPGLYEAKWLSESLRGFIEEELIVDVLSVIKGGKEASVYRCVAGPAHNGRIIAAKVYRPQQFRNLRNDAAYREGRSIVALGGEAIKENDRRSQTALRKKTSFGEELRHVSWLAHEYDALKRLYEAGASVPMPLAVSENVILMDYIGDDGIAAPILRSVHLEHKEVELLFEELVRNIRIMLDLEMIHGDLSAYNVLYWRGEITLIDFPQVVDCYNNRQAYQLFERDVTRICEYFASQGLERDSAVLAQELWQKHIIQTETIVVSDMVMDE